jgi:hypothetical protein
MDQETKQFLTDMMGVMNKNTEVLREEMHDGFGKVTRRMNALEDVVGDLRERVAGVEETTQDNNRILLLLEHSVNEKIDVVHDDHEQTKRRVTNLEVHVGLVV